VDILEAILACEHEFGISFDVDLRPEALASVRSLAAAIQAKVTT
jgi:acyl carrier protein